MSEDKTTKILEVTLRDGSYTIDFQFTASDTALICQELEGLGFDLIEIGHGVGLGASRAGKGKAAESDETYLRVAAETLKKASWGMFCIPGIATLEDIDMAAEYGMSFIRIGTDVTEMEQSEPFIARGKRHGMFVSANFMKSYAMEPDKFAEKAVLTQKYGSDILSIADSAGGMLTEDMEKYFLAVQEKCDIKLGFHGHNNLDLALANSLKAVELGATIIDTSLQGIGRGAGNTPTEIFILALERKGIRMGINPLKVMDVGDKYIKPLLTRHGYDAIDMISGYAQFHSSYMGLIREYSSKYRIDPRRLIMAVTEEDKVNAPREMVDRIAKEISKVGDEVFTARFRIDRYHGEEQTNNHDKKST
jgi:4-hydroxy-2-oxovalerate aldolase